MSDAWPHTSRWLPWLIAGFLALAWLLPIDSITPRGFSLFDLKLDRVLLAAMGLVWVASVCAGGASAPRLRGLGAVGATVGAVALVAMFSILADMHVLLYAQDSELGLKKLLLLGSYVAFFLIVATSLRAVEAERFVTLFVWLGAIAAVGIVYDRTFGVNPFFWLAEHLLPGQGFAIRPIDTSPGDPHPVTGPSRHGLGAATMLAMVVPFALVRAVQQQGRRRTFAIVLFVIVMTGVWATNRKTGLFASAGAILTLVLFRPRAMLVGVLPLLGLGLFMLALVKPQGVSYQLERLAPGALAKGASSQGRSADYPAISPDVRAHPLLGRGWGTYAHDKYRILDNNYLLLLIEVGILGLAAFVAMVASVWVTAARLVGREGRRPRDGPALAAAAGASAFAIAMALFDALSYAQVPYFFFFLAALVAIERRESVAGCAVARPAGAPGAGTVRPCSSRVV